MSFVVENIDEFEHINTFWKPRLVQFRMITDFKTEQSYNDRVIQIQKKQNSNEVKKIGLSKKSDIFVGVPGEEKKITVEHTYYSIVQVDGQEKEIFYRIFYCNKKNRTLYKCNCKYYNLLQEASRTVINGITTISLKPTLKWKLVDGADSQHSVSVLIREYKRLKQLDKFVNQQKIAFLHRIDYLNNHLSLLEGSIKSILGIQNILDVFRKNCVCNSAVQKWPCSKNYLETETKKIYEEIRSTKRTIDSFNQFSSIRYQRHPGTRSSGKSKNDTSLSFRKFIIRKNQPDVFFISLVVSQDVQKSKLCFFVEVSDSIKHKRFFLNHNSLITEEMNYGPWLFKKNQIPLCFLPLFSGKLKEEKREIIFKQIQKDFAVLKSKKERKDKDGVMEMIDEIEKKLDVSINTKIIRNEKIKDFLDDLNMNLEESQHHPFFNFEKFFQTFKNDIANLSIDQEKQFEDLVIFRGLIKGFILSKKICAAKISQMKNKEQIFFDIFNAIDKLELHKFSNFVFSGISRIESSKESENEEESMSKKRKTSLSNTLFSRIVSIWVLVIALLLGLFLYRFN